jgi:FkbM family methyltransferase
VYSIFAAAANPSAHVIALEPNPHVFAVLEANLALNPALRVAPHSLALADHNGNETFYLAGGTSSLNPEFRQGGVETVSVTVAKGDDFISRTAPDGRLDLVKIDTETTEPSVLRGLAGTISRDLPDIVCEVLPDRTERELEAFFAPLGYEAFWLTDRGPIRRARLAGDASMRHLNYLFRHPGAARPPI